MRVWEEWVVGGLVGWLVGEQRGGKGCVREGRWGGALEGEAGRREGVLSNLGVHFGVWKTVGLFQLECNISSEHAPAL